MAGTYTNLLFHMVFSTKNRVPLITRLVQKDLHAYMGGIIRGEKATLLEIGGVADHVHLLAKLKPTHSVAGFLQVVKAKSSKWFNGQKRGPSKFDWQDGYAAFTVSESRVAAVRQYIQTQETHHRRLSFQDELRTLLKKHGVEFDERYLWG